MSTTFKAVMLEISRCGYVWMGGRNERRRRRQGGGVGGRMVREDSILMKPCLKIAVGAMAAAVVVSQR